jgi:uncharacterized protein
MNTLGLFVKYPAPGQVKTRLARDWGAERAADLYAGMTADLIDLLRTAADRRILCYTPETELSVAYFRDLAGNDFDIQPQSVGVLGERMYRFFAEHLAQPEDRAVLIGSDSPTLPPEMIERAFAALEQADCVLGPATDGGYYLIGQRGRAQPIFDKVEWSSPSVLEQTVAQIAALRIDLAVLPPWYDLDTMDDLQTLRGHVRALQYAGSPHPLKRTCAALWTK